MFKNPWIAEYLVILLFSKDSTAGTGVRKASLERFWTIYGSGKEV